ncbi:uncharacterized protein Z520_12331 [Fonsecaea multimorphosa CBS 102226]|uniref:FAD/NAD(P)-binding domain-containing protein n=1 Tax=Fonsecaea multimorphosa CBS 102226 TaxID=1442371 RepID=A0A0D2JFJ3_9EURO|nr:uncharacterized protein Z520_12331 [Fonsecaea multimorphosa CBS 102226]KIX91942.1 hypothetical protein Z520_12331 [Fonsecaea multimorphosa CBS 102226]OAL17313.1 hypothetical protein AYO22_11755 [Fonsecaea multimorphosa]OQU97759.1 hypothetical protein CLAIMM_03644 [Cladophialophora immunda]
MGSMGADKQWEVLIVGGGFGGMYLLNKLRKFGFNVHLYEAGSEFGGTWHWNCYPGARVDSIVPTYQFSSEETWDQWEWSEAYPKRDELDAYFRHIGKLWNLYADASFHCRVVSTHWNADEKMWTCEISNEQDNTTTIVKTRMVLFCAGLASVPYKPPYQGVDDFEGTIYHTSRWPHEGVDLKGKRCAILGTGATGVQVTQEIGPIASHLTVFQRTPNIALPMDQAPLRHEDNIKIKKDLPDIMEMAKTTWAGFLISWNEKNTFDVTPEEREALYEELWNKGGFNFWVGNYKDTSVIFEASDAAYKFWRKKTAPLIKDEWKRDKLCPEVPPNPFGTKRISLYTTYYDIFNLSHVDLVDINETPIESFTKKGIRLANGDELEFDVIILATGFDTITGGLTHVDIRGTDPSFTLAEKWKKGCHTYMGMCSNGFPNFFFVFGPQSPAPFSIAPNCIEYQGNWLTDMLRDLRRDHITTIECTRDAEEEWREQIIANGEKGLFKYAKSWWFGANIPGKARECYIYMQGMPQYRKTCGDIRKQGYPGFVLK